MSGLAMPHGGPEHPDALAVNADDVQGTFMAAPGRSGLARSYIFRRAIISFTCVIVAQTWHLNPHLHGGAQVGQAS